MIKKWIKNGYIVYLEKKVKDGQKPQLYNISKFYEVFT